MVSVKLNRFALCSENARFLRKTCAKKIACRGCASKVVGGGAASVAITALKASFKRFGDSPLKRVNFKFYSLK